MKNVVGENSDDKSLERENQELQKMQDNHIQHLRNISMWSARLDSFSQSLLQTRVTGFTFSHQSKVQAPFGDKELRRYSIVTDTNYNIIYFNESKEPFKN